MAGCCSTCCGNWRRNRQPEEKPGQEKPGKNRDGGSQFPITPSVPVCGLLLPFPRSRGKVPKADGGGGRVGPALTPTLSRKRERVEKASGTISLSTPQGGANRTWLAPPRLSRSENRDEESKQQHDEEHQCGQAGDQPCDAHQAAEGRFDAAACILIRHRTTAPRTDGCEFGKSAIALPTGNRRHIRFVHRQGSGHAVRHVRVACAETRFRPPGKRCFPSPARGGRCRRRMGAVVALGRPSPQPSPASGRGWKRRQGQLA